MNKNYTDSARQVLKLAEKTAKTCGHSYIGSEHLLLGLVLESKGTAGTVLRAHHVEQEKLKELIGRLVAPEEEGNLLSKEGWTPRVRSILHDSSNLAELLEHRATGTEHFLLAILKDIECVAARLLHTMEVNLQKLYMDLLEIMGVQEDRYKDLIKAARSEGNGLANTPVLDQYSRDLTELAVMKKLDVTVGRQQETDRIIQILSRRTKNNPCLIGEPGEIGRAHV